MAERVPGAKEQIREREIAHILLNTEGVVNFDFKEGFQFSSKMHSPVYINLQRLAENRVAWRKVLSALRELVVSQNLKCHRVAGVATGALNHSPAVADRLGKGHITIRKSQKEHGAKDRVSGDVRDKQVIVFEDMVSTGESLVRAIYALLEAGGKVAGCISIATYDFPQTKRDLAYAKIPLHSLLHVRTIAEEAFSQDKITAQQFTEFQTWLRNPNVWRPHRV